MIFCGVLALRRSTSQWCPVNLSRVWSHFALRPQLQSWEGRLGPASRVLTWSWKFWATVFLSQGHDLAWCSDVSGRFILATFPQCWNLLSECPGCNKEWYCARECEGQDSRPLTTLSLFFRNKMKNTITSKSIECSIYRALYTLWINHPKNKDVLLVPWDGEAIAGEVPLSTGLTKAARGNFRDRSDLFLLSPWRSRRMLFAAVAKASLRLPVPG